MNLSKSRQSISSMKYECQVKWIIFTGLYKSQTGYIAKYFTLLKKIVDLSLLKEKKMRKLAEYSHRWLLYFTKQKKTKTKARIQQKMVKKVSNQIKGFKPGKNDFRFCFL